MSALLDIEDLAVTFGNGTAAVRGASFTVAPGETHCLVGESGCGKSVTALSVMNLLARNAVRRAEKLAFEGEDLLKLSDKVSDLMEITRLYTVFDIEDDEAKAVAAFGHSTAAGA